MQITIIERAVLVERIIQINEGIFAFLLLCAAAPYNIITIRQFVEGSGCIGRIASIVLISCNGMSYPAVRGALFIADAEGDVFITTRDLKPALPCIIAAAQDIDLPVNQLHFCAV